MTIPCVSKSLFIVCSRTFCIPDLSSPHLLSPVLLERCTTPPPVIYPSLLLIILPPPPPPPSSLLVFLSSVYLAGRGFACWSAERGGGWGQFQRQEKSVAIFSYSCSLPEELWARARKNKESRDFVCLCWLIAPSYMSPKAWDWGGGGLRCLSHWAHLHI